MDMAQHAPAVNDRLAILRIFAEIVIILFASSATLLPGREFFNKLFGVDTLT